MHREETEAGKPTDTFSSLSPFTAVLSALFHLPVGKFAGLLEKEQNLCQSHPPGVKPCYDSIWQPGAGSRAVAEGVPQICDFLS
jgi:hypothetical protein